MEFDKVHVKHVFTPGRPARLTFVERVQINNKLVSAIRTPGKQVIVYGHSGSGKTTLLLNKLHQLYEDHVRSLCTEETTFEQLVLDAFDQLGPFYLDELKRDRTKSIAPALKMEFLGIKAILGGKSEHRTSLVAKRLLPPQLTPQRLAGFLGAAGCCWVLDDFHKVADDEKRKLAHAAKNVYDTADDYPAVKVIAIGAVDTARQIVQLASDMKGRVAEIHVPLMSPDELRQILVQGEELLNFRLTPSTREGIVRYSNGLASVCHQLGLNVCEAAHIVRRLPEKRFVGEAPMRTAVQEYLDQTSDTLKHTFDMALRMRRTGRYDNCRLIISALVACGQDGGTHSQILAEIRKHEPRYPASNVTRYLRQLVTEDRGSLLRHDATSGRYSFADPIYRAYALTILSGPDKPSLTETHLAFDGNVVRLRELLQKYMEGR